MQTPTQLIRHLWPSSHVTVGISSKGNTRALSLCLNGVLNAVDLPKAIQVRLEGEDSGLADFYLGQLGDLALLKGVKLSFSVCASEGVRRSRDWQLDNCSTPFLWMLDDDAVPDYRCLRNYAEVYNRSFAPRIEQEPMLAFFAGSKADVNNQRHYPFFDPSPVSPLYPLAEDANHSLIYDPAQWAFKWSRTKALDTGNCFLFVPKIRASGVRFHHCPEHRNSSGDATSFWLRLSARSYSGWFVPSAAAFHLEKPNGGFNEFEARGEMLLRLCELEKLSKDELAKYWMPDSWKKG